MTGTQVLTEKQARHITGGRKPLVPVEYEAACKALQACIDIDEAKYWADKADALAAWAKVYRDDKVGRQAKQLKLLAYRRIGELARELRPQGSAGSGKIIDGKKLRGRLKGPKSLLREHGMPSGLANAATRLSRLPKSKFDEIVNQPVPPAPTLGATTDLG